MGRNIGTLDFKTETVAETTLCASWIWSPSAPIPGTWGIFASPGDSKLTPDGLNLHWNWTQHNFLNAHFRDSGPKYSPTSLKTERVAETALLASWVWQTSGRYSRTWGIFYSPRNSKLTPDSLGFQWNGQSKTFWTLTLELPGRNKAPLYFKT